MPDLSDTRFAAGRAAWVCAALALVLVGSYYWLALFWDWTRGLALLSGGVALAGAGLAAYSLHPAGWSELRRWPTHAAFGFNLLFAVAFFLAAPP
ncbi:MAG TPA: hypothetical protein VM489_11785 [Burkholderiales bacterium]|nr:hypothetical protein [Burkholderiales bacterium]